MVTRRLAVTVPVSRSQTAAGPGPSGEGSRRPGPAPPPGVWVAGGHVLGLPGGLKELRELQGKRPAIPARGEMPGEEQRGRRRVMRGVVGVVRVGEEGLLLGGVSVGMRGAGAANAEAAAHRGRPAVPVAPPTQAVGARPAEGKRLKTEKAMNIHEQLKAGSTLLFILRI